MTPEKARIIVRHHIGSVPHLVKRAGPHADDWEVVALSSDGMIHVIAPTPEEAARAAADQLRAAGWRPTHALHDIAALLSTVEAQQQEIARLRAGGCARDQRTTQFCAEAVARDEEIARLRAELDAARPGVVLLHQRWEGEEACLHCGKPLPWPDMDVCPRERKNT